MMAAILSASGGAGVPSLTAAIGSAIAHMGKRVLAVDLNAGARALDIPLGMQDLVFFDLSDALSGSSGTADALVSIGADNGGRLSLLAAPYDKLSERLDASQLSYLLEPIESEFDIILLDAPTGASYTALSAALVSDKTLQVIVPENAQLRAAERMISAISGNRPNIIINRGSPELVTSGIQLSPDACAMTLDAPIIAVCDEDAAFRKMSALGTLTDGANRDAHSPALSAIDRIARRLIIPEEPFPKRVAIVRSIFSGLTFKELFA